MNRPSQLNKIPAIFVLPIVVCFALLVRCSNTQIVDGGTQTETTNCSLDGTLYGPDGQLIQAGTKVRIHPRQTPDDTTFPIYTHFDTATVFTNDSGKFSFDSLDAGVYVIEADNGVLYGLIDSIVYSNPDSTLEVVDTLWAPGVISGIVKFAQGGDPRAAFVVVWGLERLGQVQADGGFSLATMAAGAYTVRFIPLLSNYGIKDVPGVVVKPGEITALDTVVIPYTGIPIPIKPAIVYDTLKQLVTLSWNKADSARVRGYNVYRMLEGTTNENILLNGNVPVRDTAYLDSTATPGNTYKYRITCVDTAGMEGVKSEAAEVTLFNAFTVIDSLVMGNGTAPGQFGNSTKLSVSPTGSIYIVDKKNNRLQKLSTNGTTVFTVGNFGLPIDVTIGANGLLFVADYSKNSVSEFDTTGKFKTSWKTSTSPASLAIDSQRIYVATESTIEWFNIDGTPLGKYDYPSSFLYKGKEIKANAYGDIFGVFGDSLYLFDKSSGSLKSICRLKVDVLHQDPQLSFPRNGIVCVSTNNLNEPQNSNIDVIAISTKSIVASWCSPQVITDICWDDAKGLVSVSKDGIIYYLKSGLPVLQ
jgi:hypothetical protein